MKVTEDKIILSFAVFGMASLYTLIVLATVNYVAPFCSFDSNGNSTFFATMLLYGIYAVEVFVGMLLLWTAILLAVFYWRPKKNSSIRTNKSVN